MSGKIAFTRWPENEASSYREKGYWLDKPLTDIIFRDEASQYNDSIAIITADRQYSYEEFKNNVLSLAGSLQNKGLEPGDRAVVQLGNCAEFYFVFFALLYIGVVPVNALASHRQTELNSYADQLQPKLFVGDRNSPIFKNGDAYIEELKSHSSNLDIVLFLHEDLESHFSSNHKATLSASGAGEVAFFNLSGGSTGTPKLIPRTHNDYYYSIRQSVVVCEFDKSTRYLVAIPAPHNFPVSSPGAFGTFYAGGSVVMANDPSVTSSFPLIKEYGVTVAALVPPAASLWLQEISSNASNANALESLRLLQIGGARLSPILAKKLNDALPKATLQQVLGMAEGLVNYTRIDDPIEKKLTTQGRPMSPDDEVYVADPEGSGKKLGPNEVGLLMTRGPYTFRGYYNSPEHNKSSFNEEGFYCSGDLISIDEDGYITVHGRQKDQINRGGEKISAEEIENLLLRHPDVLEAGIVAIDDDLMGEKSCAFVMTRAPVKPVTLRKFLREQGIADFKIPDKFKELPELPLTPVGKVDKKQLRLIKA